MKNKKIYILVIVIIIILLLPLITYEIFNKNIDNHNQSFLNEVITAHPELKEEIITAYNKSRIISIPDNFNNEIIKTTYLKDKFILSNYFNYMIILILMIIILVYFKYNQKNKIKDINEYLSKVNNGDYTLNISEYSEDNFSLLQDEIYKITVKLREQNSLLNNHKKNLEDLISDISHQLKTPLTSMYVINDLLLNNKLTSEKREEILHKNYQQLERLNYLVESLLKISRLDNKVIKLQIKENNLISLVNDVIDDFQDIITQKNITFQLDEYKDMLVNFDYKWTREAIYNVIKNACEHTFVDGRLTIKIESNPLYTVLIITNTGPTIISKDLRNIFKRFYKGQNSRSDGLGIGLNLAYKILKEENALIYATSKNETTNFIIKFYKSDKNVTK